MRRRVRSDFVTGNHQRDKGLWRIPLFSRVFSDPSITFAKRAVDCRWYYAGFSKLSPLGFNPFSNTLLIGHYSRMADWLARGGSPRRFNLDDRLVKEAMFLVHDYLHCWAYSQVREIRPQLKLGTGLVSLSRIEDLAFAHLLSEAAATVGLDYWYLSRVNLDTVCSIGTNFRELAVTYREDRLREYRRFLPDLNVQTPHFFVKIVVVYCTGEWPGLGVSDIAMSPALASWIRHELNYGVLQRRYIRRWLTYLAGGDSRAAEAVPDRPVSVERGWRRQMAQELAERLWQLVSRPQDFTRVGTAEVRDVWRSRREDGLLDPALINWNRLSAADRERMLRTATKESDFDVAASQLLAMRNYGTTSPTLYPAIRLALETRNLPALAGVLGVADRITAKDQAPRDLMLLG